MFPLQIVGQPEESRQLPLHGREDLFDTFLEVVFHFLCSGYGEVIHPVAVNGIITFNITKQTYLFNV